MRESIDQIWSQFSNSLKGFIRKRVKNEHDAEDILQDVFFKVHSNIHKLDNKEKFEAWIYKITRNAIIDYYRRGTNSEELIGIPENIADQQFDVPDYYEKETDSIFRCFEPMINCLPEKYKEAITLTYFSGLNQKQVAEKLGLSHSGAKSRVQRAREKLKEMLLDCCHLQFDRLGNVLDFKHKDSNCQYCPKCAGK